jgi:hypothetical protein
VSEVFGASALRVGVVPLQLCRLLGWPHPPLSMVFQHLPVSSLMAFARPRSSSSASCTSPPRRRPPIVRASSPALGLGVSLCISFPRRRSPIVRESASSFPAPWRQLPIVRASASDLGLGVNLCTSPPWRPPLALPRSLASSAHCASKCFRPWSRRQPLHVTSSASASRTLPLLGVVFPLCRWPFSSAFSDTFCALPSVRFYRQ